LPYFFNLEKSPSARGLASISTQGRQQKNFEEGGGKGKIRPKNSTIKPPSTLSLYQYHI